MRCRSSAATGSGRPPIHYCSSKEGIINVPRILVSHLTCSLRLSIPLLHRPMPTEPDPPDHESTSTSTSIPRIDLAAASPPLLRAFLDANAPPFLLLNVATQWKATRDWVAPGEEENFVTIDLLEAAFRGRGNNDGSEREVVVPVVECRSGDGDEDDDTEGQRAGGGSSSVYGEEPRRERTLTEYAALWRSGEAEARGLYLKDWHIIQTLRDLGDAGGVCGAEEGKARQNAYISSSVTTVTAERVKSEDDGKGVGPGTATSSINSSTTPSTSSESLASSPYYTVPSPLDDDWLNGWWDAPATDAGHAAREDDYRFLYLGPKGTTTGVHHDVLCSYSWSVNLAGIKEWTLFPPPPFSPLPSAAAGADLEPRSVLEGTGQEEQTQTIGTRQTSMACGSRSANDSSPSADAEAALPLVVRQGPGELMFVPSGWHHKVRNLTGCLSINHNWFNRSSLARVWAFLKEEARAVQEKLEHLRDTFDEEVNGWERQCEVVLRANSAMNLTEWVGLLLWKASEVRRVGQAVDRSEARQDLAAVLSVLKEVASSPKFVNFLFPPHLHEGQEQAAEEESPCLPLRVDLMPRVEAWLAAEIRQIETSLEMMCVYREEE